MVLVLYNALYSYETWSYSHINLLELSYIYYANRWTSLKYAKYTEFWISIGLSSLNNLNRSEVTETIVEEAYKLKYQPTNLRM